MLFQHILQFAENINIDRQAQLNIDQLSLAIYRIIKSKNANYKITNIKYGLQKIMKHVVIVDAKTFAAILETT